MALNTQNQQYPAVELTTATPVPAPFEYEYEQTSVDISKLWKEVDAALPISFQWDCFSFAVSLCTIMMWYTMSSHVHPFAQPLGEIFKENWALWCPSLVFVISIMFRGIHHDCKVLETTTSTMVKKALTQMRKIRTEEGWEEIACSSEETNDFTLRWRRPRSQVGQSATNSVNSASNIPAQEQGQDTFIQILAEDSTHSSHSTPVFTPPEYSWIETAAEGPTASMLPPINIV